MRKINCQWFGALIDGGRKHKRLKNNIDEIKNLLYFFVDSCPSQKGPVCNKKFADYGLKYPCHYSKYKKMMFESIPWLKANYAYIQPPKKVDDFKEKIMKSYNGKKKPLIYFCKGEYGEMDSLFIRFRNAFAHKNYIKKGDYYIIWNYGRKDNQINAFMMLKHSHLKTIFETLENFKKSLKVN